jgi:hypothetical protein
MLFLGERDPTKQEYRMPFSATLLVTGHGAMAPIPTIFRTFQTIKKD